MKICDDNHEEIAFEGSGRFVDCPLCVVKAELQDELNVAAKRIEELEEDLEAAKEAANEASA